jgi:hypothetical protein
VPRKRKSRKFERNVECDEEAVRWEPPEMDNTENVERSCELEELNAFEKYFDAVLSNCAGFFHISKNIFVVQGWDARKGQATVDDQLSYEQLSV